MILLGALARRRREAQFDVLRTSEKSGLVRGPRIMVETSTALLKHDGRQYRQLVRKWFKNVGDSTYPDGPDEPNILCLSSARPSEAEPPMVSQDALLVRPCYRSQCFHGKSLLRGLWRLRNASGSTAMGVPSILHRIRATFRPDVP